MEQAVVGILLFFAVWGGILFYQKYKGKKRMLAMIRRNWGKWPDREYTPAEFKTIRSYSEHKKATEHMVDDITWNDLDMDTIFMMFNNTYSAIGEGYLYDMLRRPVCDREVLEEREFLISHFLEESEEREKMQYFCAKIGKMRYGTVFDYIYNLAELEIRGNAKHYACIAAMLLATASIFLKSSAGALVFVCALAANWSIYLKDKKKMAPYIRSCACVLSMLDVAEQLEKQNTPVLKPYIEKVRAARKRFGKFKRNTIFVMASDDTAMSADGGLTKMVLSYVNFTFHTDLIQFQTLIKELKKHIGDFEVIADNIGLLESATAIASFRVAMPEHCVPVMRGGREVYLKAENLYHPILQDPVKNSIEAKKGVLLTGSNASGKSTFLKTVAINAILAQTVNTCLADSYEGTYSQIYSSMSLKDDIESNESYYMVEIRALKRILDKVEEETPLLCFVDEVLRGTNTVERIAASTEIMKSMARSNVMCFAATHDIELTHLLEKDYDNYHFQEEILDDDIVFNYKLYTGRAVTRNAISLLAIMGYDSNIVEHAKARAERFVETGEWR